MRYCYHSREYHQLGAKHGLFCNPVKKGGKCIRGRNKNQLVKVEDGRLVVVAGRALRLVAKCRIHGDLQGGLR